MDIPSRLQAQTKSELVTGMDLIPSHILQTIVTGTFPLFPLHALELETPAKPFTISSKPCHVSAENKTLLPHANPEVEKKMKWSRKIHQQRSIKVVSSGNSLAKHRTHSVSEGSTPLHSLKKKNSTSDDGFVSPYVVHELKDCLRQLEERVANDADEKNKLEGLYISEKQKREEVELRSSEYEREVEKLRKVVYKLDKFGKHADLPPDEKSLVQSVRAEQGMEVSS